MGSWEGPSVPTGHGRHPALEDILKLLEDILLCPDIMGFVDFAFYTYAAVRRLRSRRFSHYQRSCGPCSASAPRADAVLCRTAVEAA